MSRETWTARFGSPGYTFGSRLGFLPWAGHKRPPGSFRMMMRKFPLSFFLFGFVLLATRPVVVQAQVTPTAFRNPISLTVGGTASLFNPDYLTNNLGGLGAYV